MKRARSTGKRRWQHAAAKLVVVIVSAAGAVLLHEIGMFLLLRHPRWVTRLPAALARHVRDVYLTGDRTLIQFSQHTRFDPELLYTLQPGRFVQREREFAVEYDVNELGVRDDDASLHGADVIVLGDSYAMGWGVSQDEAFPSVLEQLSGLRTLNAGISSYGTLRELRLLDRIDHSHARFIVVQYCSNDVDENLALLDGSFHVPGIAKYEHAVAAALRDRHYWFGRYAWRLIQQVREPKPLDVGPVLEARAFANALQHAGRTELDGRRLYVLTWESAAFVSALEAERHRPGAPPLLRDLHVVSLVGAFSPLDYYVLDDHWTPAGHRKVAQALLAAFEH